MILFVVSFVKVKVLYLDPLGFLLNYKKSESLICLDISLHGSRKQIPIIVFISSTKNLHWCKQFQCA